MEAKQFAKLPEYAQAKLADQGMTLTEARATIDALAKALEDIIEHGMPAEGSTEQAWRSCVLSVDRIARQALNRLSRGR